MPCPTIKDSGTVESSLELSNCSYCSFAADGGSVSIIGGGDSTAAEQVWKCSKEKSAPQWTF
jgi:hypothetical protein